MDKKVLQTREMTEEVEAPFSAVTEAGIDTDNHMLSGVCIFGTKKSKNNRIYTNKAVESLASLTEGAKCYVDHPTHDELKQRDGTRSIKDWIGVFESSRRQGDKVFANLRCREAYFDLLKDVALLQPKGVGMSINARVKVFADEKGMESVEDIDFLKSADLVSSAACTSSIWEGLQEKVEEENNKPEQRERLVIVPEAVERNVELLFVQEGIIQDKLNNDKIRSEINDIAYTANRLIENIVYDEKLSITDKKKKVIAVFDDLSKEVKKRVSGIKESKDYYEEEDEEMDLNKLKTEHQDLVEAIIAEYKETEEVKSMKADLSEAQDQLKAKDETIETQTKQIEELKKENTDLKTRMDEIELQEKVSEKKDLMNRLIKEAQLKDEYVSDIFMANLMALEEYKNDEEEAVTVEEQAKAMITDRKQLAESGSGKVKGSGDEFTEGNEDEKEKAQKVTEQDVDDFAGKINKR